VPTLPNTFGRSEARCGLLYSLFGDRVGSHSKAFDTVPHDKLMYKLEKYGIKGDFHKWLTSFLTKREMRVIRMNILI
jgi:DNA-directed RNA polymerase sigma subunit (sigma70/sigma32)